MPTAAAAAAWSMIASNCGPFGSAARAKVSKGTAMEALVNERFSTSPGGGVVRWRSVMRYLDCLEFLERRRRRRVIFADGNTMKMIAPRGFNVPGKGR